MSEITTGRVTSADGTAIAFDRCGDGPAVVLVQGSFTDRAHPTWAGLARALAPQFTVFNYDRRGRGGSDDTAPYEVQREIEDLAALIAEAGGSAMVFGGSSGAALALEAAAHGLPFQKLALFEPPYHVDDTAPVLPADFESQLDDLVRAGRRGDAAELYMTRAADIPANMVAGMRAQPFWQGIEAVAHTLVYEAALMGPGNALPAERLKTITVRALVLTGGNSPAWMINSGKAIAEVLPDAARQVLEGQSHDVSPEALTPVLLTFFNAPASSA